MEYVWLTDSACGIYWELIDGELRAALGNVERRGVRVGIADAQAALEVQRLDKGGRGAADVRLLRAHLERRSEANQEKELHS